MRKTRDKYNKWYMLVFGRTATEAEYQAHKKYCEQFARDFNMFVNATKTEGL